MKNYLKGLLLMLQGRAEGTVFFPQNLTAAKHSFLLALWLMPLYIYMMYRLQIEDGAVIPELVPFLIIQASVYTLYWVLYPLVVYYLARYLDRPAAYPSYIIMYNWVKAAQIILLSLLWAVGETGWVNESTFMVLNTALMVILVVAEWNIIRFGLRLGGLMPLNFLFLEGIIGLLIAAVAELLLPN